jgi:hypothetical protein
MNENVKVAISIGAGCLAGYLVYKGVSNALKKASLSELIAVSIGITVGSQIVDGVASMLVQKAAISQ